ncbi:MAG TPA: LuxR C-terminal-related transcriptional regulator [Solirubrobacteraceae bacterium]|nr:LuxR C-terminal-related transcriptional regulator [Solirubrobacteraceae bacterium]
MGVAVVDPVAELEQGRRSYAAQAWGEAHRRLSGADRAAPLAAEDLERLATAAYMLGREDEYLQVLERSHQAHLEADDPARAVRCAFWLTMGLAMRGQIGLATGWRGRAQRLLERMSEDCVEHGYLLLPRVVDHRMAGDYNAAHDTAAAVAAIAERFAESDLHALAVHEQGLCLTRLGWVDEGLRLLDEAMVAVVGGELSPIVTGLVYCSVIDGCQEVYATRRAQEWTAALTHWCDEQPDMVAFTGRCLIHRAEIMQLRGAWDDALREARRAGEQPSRATGQAFYRQGELHRLQGELDQAEEAYREASRRGAEPQPGLALLRLAQDNGDAATAMIRRALTEATEPLARVRLLPACVEILLAAGDVDGARDACAELEPLAAPFSSGLLDAAVSQVRGAVELAGGDARAALAALRRSGEAWQELGVPYEHARVRVLVGRACRQLGDDDSAELELEAARTAFDELGAGADVARVDALLGRAERAHGLTPRELEVLRLVAAGETNRAIAATLVLSERTVDRHVSNICAKLGASGRTAATAYAFRHRLV